MPDEQGYLSFDEVREMLGVTESHLHNLVRANELRAFRVEGAMKFKRPDVEKLLVEGFPEAAEAEEAAATAVSPDDETMALLGGAGQDEFLVEDADEAEMDLVLGDEPEEASRPPLILVEDEDGAGPAPATQALPAEEPETVRAAPVETPRDETATELDFTDEVGFDILEDVEPEDRRAPPSADVVVEEEPPTEDEEVELVPETEEELWGDRYARTTMTVAAPSHGDRVTPVLLVITALVALYPLLLFIHLASRPMVAEEDRGERVVYELTTPGYLDFFRQTLGADGWMGRAEPKR